MVNKVLDAITIALHTTFGDAYTYYREEVEQNAAKPYFKVDTVTSLSRSTRSINRYNKTVSIIIHYFTDKNNTLDATRDCYDIAEKMNYSLEYLPIDDTMIMGKDISWEITDGVLQFYITYNFYVERTQEYTYMEDGKYNDIALNKQKG